MVEVVTLSRDKMFEPVVMEDKSVCKYAASSSECSYFAYSKIQWGKVSYIPGYIASCICS